MEFVQKIAKNVKKIKNVQNAVIQKLVIVSFAEFYAKFSVDLQKYKFYAKIYRVFVEVYSDGSGYLMRSCKIQDYD